MNDKQQLAAMGAGQPICLQKRVEQLEAEVRSLTGLLRNAKVVISEAMPFFIDRPSCYKVEEIRNLRAHIDEALDEPQPPVNPPRVRKSGGSFQHTGSVVSSFKTLAGEPRIVLEFDAPVGGMLHTYRPDQVEPL